MTSLQDDSLAQAATTLPAGPAHAFVPFNRPIVTGAERDAVADVLREGWTGGNGPVCGRCQAVLEELTGARVLLTPSGTAALELAALLAAVGPGDEVIMPSFTFPSTANAFVLRGATPVFVDVRAEDLNVDPAAVAAAVTARTRVIAPVHYAGGSAPIDELLEIAREADVMLIEDAAQSVYATCSGRALGTFGALGALSFHETKNISSGEGGALLVSMPELVQRAEVVQEKGTNRQQFVRGEVSAYSWVDMGSSMLMSEVSAALLLCQLERGAEITAARRHIWQAYHEAFSELEAAGRVVRPATPDPDVHHNGHLYYLLAADRPARDRLIASLREERIHAQFHYVPLHSSAAGRRFGRTQGSMRWTEAAGSRLVRLPLWPGLTAADVERIAELTTEVLR